MLENLNFNDIAIVENSVCVLQNDLFCEQFLVEKKISIEFLNLFVLLFVVYLAYSLISYIFRRRR